MANVTRSTSIHYIRKGDKGDRGASVVILLNAVSTTLETWQTHAGNSAKEWAINRYVDVIVGDIGYIYGIVNNKGNAPCYLTGVVTAVTHGFTVSGQSQTLVTVDHTQGMFWYGERGERGAVGPALRVTRWADAPDSMMFQSGNSDTDAYKDIVLYNTGDYMYWCACKQNCTKLQIINAHISPITPSNPYFEQAAFGGTVATSLLLAQYALVKNLGVQALEMYGTNSDGTPNTNDIQCIIKDGTIIINNGVFSGTVSANSGNIGGLMISDNCIKASDGGNECLIIGGAKVPSIENAKTPVKPDYNHSTSVIPTTDRVPDATTYGHACYLTHTHDVASGTVTVKVTLQLDFTTPANITEVMLPDFNWSAELTKNTSATLSGKTLTAVLYSVNGSAVQQESLMTVITPQASQNKSASVSGGVTPGTGGTEDMGSATDFVRKNPYLKTTNSTLSINANTKCRIVLTVGYKVSYTPSSSGTNIELPPKVNTSMNFSEITCQSSSLGKCIYIAKDGLAVVHGANNYMLATNSAFEVKKTSYGLRIDDTGVHKLTLANGTWKSTSL